MQVVIDIDENIYTRLFDNGDTDAVDMLKACVAIRKGTPLPKGHGKLFDEKELKREAIRCEWNRSMYDKLDHTLSYMKPIIEADTESEKV